MFVLRRTVDVADSHIYTTLLPHGFVGHCQCVALGKMGLKHSTQKGAGLEIESVTSGVIALDHQITQRKVAIASALLERNILCDEVPLVGIVDFDALGDTIGSLKAAFPAHFTHAFAVKANPLPKVLAFFNRAEMACEVASSEEFDATEKAGFGSANIVYDSPAKVSKDLRRAIAVGVTLYLDNFQELSRLDKLIMGLAITSPIGIRINPQVGAGSISDTSTATATSKFGVALLDAGNRDLLIAAYVARSWLTSLHVHVGSQGCPLELSIQGIRAVVDLALSINHACGYRRITSIDIGGGLPVNFAGEAAAPTFHDYAALLRDSIPELFDGTIHVITEFGRSLISKSGFILARVEYTKITGGRRIAITHAGAQVAARTVYQPDTWPLRISTLDRHGRPKKGDLLAQDIAGPCCFAGDVLAHQRLLPPLEPGDYILVHDTGGYYFSSPYIYNSLPPIHAFAVQGPSDDLTLSTLQL